MALTRSVLHCFSQVVTRIDLPRPLSASHPVRPKVKHYQTTDAASSTRIEYLMLLMALDSPCVKRDGDGVNSLPLLHRLSISLVLLKILYGHPFKTFNKTSMTLRLVRLTQMDPCLQQHLLSGSGWCISLTCALIATFLTNKFFSRRIGYCNDENSCRPDRRDSARISDVPHPSNYRATIPLDSSRRRLSSLY